MKISKIIRMNPDTAALETVFAEVEGFAMEAEWPADAVFQVKLILEELVVNAINYGAPGGTTPIDIKLQSDGETITIEIKDVGQPFDPLRDAPSPDLSLGLEERPIGGLGLYLVRTMVDEMHYRWEGGFNHLTLITRRT